MTGDDPMTRAEIARARLADVAAEFDRRAKARHLATEELDAAPRFTFRLGRRHLFVVAGLLAAGVAAVLLWSGSGPTPDVVPAVEPKIVSAAEEPTEEVIVDVAGKVARPGIVALPVGSRVVDALEAAGGAKKGVDTSALNLARVLVDGEQILVGLPAADSAGGADGIGGEAGKVRLNTATASQLEELPGIGPVTAAAIIAWREENGPFTAVDDLIEVSGIGEATLAKLRPLVML